MSVEEVQEPEQSQMDGQESAEVAGSETLETKEAETGGEAEEPSVEEEGVAESSDLEQDNLELELGSPELEQARAQAADYLDRMTRMQAEMDNLRKRAARDVEKARKFALEPFAKELLAVADSMDMGLTAAQDAEDVASLQEGMDLTRKQLFSVLEKFNIEVLDAMGVKFNPEQHEAMTMVPNPDMEPNTVMDVIQKGYTLNGRLLRPARVIVSS